MCASTFPFVFCHENVQHSSSHNSEQSTDPSWRVRAPKAPTPTGKMADGTPFFTEEDITYQTGVSIGRIPAGSILPGSDPCILLYLKPSSTKFADYKGDPTPIKCYINSAGERVYRCLRQQSTANEDTGEKVVICTMEWVASAGVTGGTLKSHCRGSHWNQMVAKINTLSGKKAWVGFSNRWPLERKLN